MSKIPQTNTRTKVTVYDPIEGTIGTGEGKNYKEKTVDLPARITRFIGLGVQDQPEWNDQKKAPAFKAAFEFELIGVSTKGRTIEHAGTSSEKVTELDERAACQFGDMFLFPGATRGKVFDLVQAVDPSVQAVPGDLGWFIDNMLDQVVNVRVGSYMNKNGEIKNTIRSIGAVPSMFKSQVGPATRAFIGFDPYEDSDTMFAAYSKLFKFQRDLLVEAHDSDNIIFAGKEPDADADDKPAESSTTATTDVDDTGLTGANKDDKPF